MSGAELPQARPVPQRAVLVLGSSGQYDSRAARIAATLARRGHDVLLVGRRAPGVSDEETAPDGYRIVRVTASAIDGLPLPERVRRALEDRWSRRRRGSSSGRAVEPAAGSATSEPAVVPAAATVEPAAGMAAAAVEFAGRERARSLPALAGRLRGLVAGGRRIVAVILAVRSQRRNAARLVGPADVAFGMGFMGLPVALGLTRGGATRVVYDASDVYVDAGNIARLPRPIRRAFGALERRWARQAALVTTANDGYADVIGRRFGIQRPLVLLNCPTAEAAGLGPSAADGSTLAEPAAGPELVADVAPRRNRLRERLGLPPECAIVLYHGGFSPERGIEQLLDAILGVPDAMLVLMGYGSLLPALETRVARPDLRERVRILPAVPPAELIEWIAGADVAAMPIQPTTLNHRLTVPNKLFEAMAAGVPVVASDLPGMAPIVRESGCGLVVDPTDPTLIAGAIRSILSAPPDERSAWRRAGRAAVAGRYSWEHQEPLLLAALERLTGRPW